MLYFSADIDVNEISNEKCIDPRIIVLSRI